MNTWAALFVGRYRPDSLSTPPRLLENGMGGVVFL